MIEKQIINKLLHKATERISVTWPLYSFVTSNPLAGFEKIEFNKAVNHAEQLLGGKGYPKASFFKQAYTKGDLDQDILMELLIENQFFNKPEYYLSIMEATECSERSPDHYASVNTEMVKWLGQFLDEGIGEWQMPGREDGFYKAWKSLIKYDRKLSKNRFLRNLPDNHLDALQAHIDEIETEKIEDLFVEHLTALPGWTGLIKYREGTTRNKVYPLSLAEYLAVRITLIKAFDLPLRKGKPRQKTRKNELQHVWLTAWERSVQAELENKLLSPNEYEENLSPDAQLVFCIDVRSEVIRRHIENSGNYETFGYAGFFGIAMDYEDYGGQNINKSCPPILPSSLIAKEKYENSEGQKRFDQLKGLKDAYKGISKKLKFNISAAFGFVEGSGFFYGLTLIARTFLRSLFGGSEKAHETFSKPQLFDLHNQRELDVEEKAGIVHTAFKLMGWTKFAKTVVFVGHGSHTTNNPFASSLDCGACAGSKGRHNARMLASLANEPEVKAYLKEQKDVHIPEETVFVGAEHNTTTDNVILFDDHLEPRQKAALTNLKEDLNRARSATIRERLSISEEKVITEKALDWSETRPEWGLARNSAFIIGPRKLTRHLNLEGRTFLHSYNWKYDDEGAILEGILQGPMVVTQWINNHYYFTAVDNNVYGSGSKITQNVTGRFGVMQGNGSDLKNGLSLQSLNLTDGEYYHQPLRLSVYIQAPLQRVKSLFNKHEDSLLPLVKNQWIYLKVMDPEEGNRIFDLKEVLEEKRIRKRTAPSVRTKRSEAHISI